jgi:hypothetical protein
MCVHLWRKIISSPKSLPARAPTQVVGLAPWHRHIRRHEDAVPSELGSFLCDVWAKWINIWLICDRWAGHRAFYYGVLEVDMAAVDAYFTLQD